MDHSSKVYLNRFCLSIETLSWLTTVRSVRQNSATKSSHEMVKRYALLAAYLGNNRLSYSNSAEITYSPDRPVQVNSQDVWLGPFRTVADLSRE